jgi:hypothetical protein
LAARRAIVATAFTFFFFCITACGDPGGGVFGLKAQTSATVQRQHSGVRALQM